MKLKYLALLFLPLVLSGCTGNDFFDIQGSMKAPRLSQENQNLIEAAEKYLGCEFDFNYKFVNNRYCATTEHDFGSNKTYRIMICIPEINPHDLHILFLKYESLDRWHILGDIIALEPEVDKIYLKDVNDDGIDEILLCKGYKTEIYGINEKEVFKLESLENSI